MLFSFSNVFPYKYKQNDTWLYADLYANADIPLAFTKTANDSILQQVEHNYAPVFQMKKEVLEEKKQQFEADFKRQLNLAGKDAAFPDVNKSPKIYLQYGEKLLSKIYEQGILPDNVKLEGKSDIQIARTELTKHQAIAKTFTQTTAFNAMTDSLPASNLREPEFLLSLLEDKITHNLIYDEALSIQARTQEFQKFVEKRDTLKKGTLIVAKNAVISEAIFQQLECYEAFTQGSKSTNSFPTQFFFFFLFNGFLVFVLMAHYATHQPKLFASNAFLVYLLTLFLALQGIHFLLQQQEIHPLLSPMLLFPLLLKHRLSAYGNAVTLSIMVFIASQISSLPYPFTLAFICGGYFYIFADTRFNALPYGKYLHLVASVVICIFVFSITALQQHQVIEIIKSIAIFVIQLLALLATPYLIRQ